MAWQKDKQNSIYTSIILVILSSFYLITSAQNYTFAQEQNNCKKCWEELTADPEYSMSQSLRFYRLKTDNGSLATLIVLDLNDRNFVLKPFFNQKTNTVSGVIKEQRAIAGINGGFFNLNNGESTSYVVIDGKEQCDPKQNKALIDNPDLKPYLETIFNRSELRILENDKGKLKATINNHFDAIPSGWTLIHSLQTGPRLLPKITDSEEAFVRKTTEGKSFDSIGSQKQAARTAIGITRSNHILLLTIANKKQDEFSSGVTLEELAKILQNLGCNQAINCDGGTSTTMIVSQGDKRDERNYAISKVVSSEPEKLLKSGWLIEKSRPGKVKNFL